MNKDTFEDEEELSTLASDYAKLSHYQVLGVEKTATDEEIKRAYFSMVRKFQPGTNPQKFKEIRNAYETLNDKEKRAEYDAIGEMPDVAAPLFNKAMMFYKQGKYKQAAELYETILESHPELNKVQEEYAKTLSAENKDGKKTEVWEELCRRNPSNANYAKELAKCYLSRGWHKKANDEVNRSLAIDPLCLGAWVIAVNCIVMKMKTAYNPGEVIDELRTTLKKAIETVKDVKEKEWDKIFLYANAFAMSTGEDQNITACYLEEIANIISRNGKPAHMDGMESLTLILDCATDSYLACYYNEIKKIADQLPDLTADKTPRHPIMVSIDGIRKYAGIEHIEKKGFSEVFADMFKLLVSSFGDEDFEVDAEDKIELAAMEFEILNDKSTYDPQLRRLRVEFPELYALHSDFFNQALRTNDPEKMIYQRAKIIRKYKTKAGYYDEHPEYASEEPIRRTEPKLGRNDPCPCGSGKKYKKCCGK
ncbi:MAG: hypothetical protein Ta2B_09960 [Termitinemataceae bacterium]|nr:MAG: hypothetical protein Ta2B_09960 [Termitinemataceae bacterium]